MTGKDEVASWPPPALPASEAPARAAIWAMLLSAPIYGLLLWALPDASSPGVRVLGITVIGMTAALYLIFW
jgi:hypothetical protein